MYKRNEYWNLKLRVWFELKIINGIGIEWRWLLYNVFNRIYFSSFLCSISFFSLSFSLLNYTFLIININVTWIVTWFAITISQCLYKIIVSAIALRRKSFANFSPGVASMSCVFFCLSYSKIYQRTVQS